MRLLLRQSARAPPINILPCPLTMWHRFVLQLLGGHSAAQSPRSPQLLANSQTGKSTPFHWQRSSVERLTLSALKARQGPQSRAECLAG